MKKLKLKTMKKATFLTKLLCISLVCALPLLRGAGVCSAQNIAINATGATPNASALLDIDAAPTNDKGLLIPRVSLTQTTSNAPIGAGIATSLLVYNTATINDVTPGYYYWGGAAWVRFATGSGGGTTVSMQTFTSSGTYTPTVGTQYVVVHMVGGGAGGWNAGSGNFGGGGGGAGEYATKVFSAAIIGVSQIITIGLGGTPISAGRTINVGALLTAVGAPATTGFYGGVGGVGGTGGGLHVQGGSGANGVIQTLSGPTYYLFGGNGGASYFGSGGRGGTGQLDSGQSGNAYGSGGGGNGYWNGTWGANAGTGKSGVVIIYEYQ
ncbi:MAG: hypothetical protein HYU68_07595 [Bacteroidetes bacterium]|nr:hypothetical protein [Bacteroidota bacterium]